MTPLHDFLTARANDLERIARGHVGPSEDWAVATAVGRQVRLVRALLDSHVPSSGQTFDPCLGKRCGKAFCNCPAMGPACEECGKAAQCPTLIMVAGALFSRHQDFREEWSA